MSGAPLPRYWRCEAGDPHYGGGAPPPTCPVCRHGKACGQPCVETDQQGNRKRRAKVEA